MRLFKIIGTLKLCLLMFMVKILDILEKDPFVYVGWVVRFRFHVSMFMQ